jgi:hypothetical protein
MTTKQAIHGTLTDSMKTSEITTNPTILTANRHHPSVGELEKLKNHKDFLPVCQYGIGILVEKNEVGALFDRRNEVFYARIFL